MPAKLFATKPQEMPPPAVEDEAIQMNDEMLENGAPEPQESNPVDSVKGKVQTLLENTPTDFGAWTLLLSEVENTSPNDIQRICLVYDAFLSEFPLCYGYWKKYASHKARLCTLYEVEELYERALQIASYSVDIWVSYCSFAMLSYEDPADIRRLYERALSFVGKDYLCHLLWDRYIEFEYSQKQWSRLAHIYINTLRSPIKKLHSYYASFKKLVATLEEDIECQKDNEVSSEFVSNCGTEKVKDCGYTEISNVIRDLLGQQDGLPRPNAVKKYLTIGELFYQRSNELDRKISYFEAQIRRPYFHVKPLDDCQLENWHQYLDFVEMQGNFDWTVKLYERCLIPCANYSEFWIRYVEFVDARGGREIAKYALDRALTIFLKRVPAFHAYCAMFKEQIGDVCGARTLFLQSVTDSAPKFIENVNREANMEKRMGNIDAACMIYEKAIEMAREKHVLQILPVLYTNFAQFTFLALGSIDAAREVFVKGIQQMPSRSILERLIRFITMHGGAGQIPNLDSIVANAIAPESNVSKALSSQDREDISKLFLEFVELYGAIHDIRKAWDRHRKLFPHIMRPSFNFTVPEKNTVDKSKEGRDQILVSLSHHICGDKSHGGSDRHLMDDPQLKNSTGILCEGVIIHKLPSEEDNSGTKDIEEQVVLAEVKEQSIPEGIELDVEINELTHECPDVAENPGVSPEPSEIGNQVKALPDHESSDDLRPPALDSLSINCPDTCTQQQSNLVTLNEHGVCQELSSVLDGSRVPDEHNVHQEPTFVMDGDKEQDGGNADKVSEVHEPSLQDMKSTPFQANLQNVDSPLHPASDLDPSEAEIDSQLQMQAQSQTSSHQGSPASGACPQNSSSAGNGAQMYYGRHASEDSSTSSHGCVQASHSQQWQGLAQMQYPPAATKSQTLPGYPFLPQAWSSAQDQQANQTQGQYQLAATQAYSTGNLAWPGQNIQQQGFVHAQPQLSTHATSQPQSEVYQQSVQTNEHIKHSQGYQGFVPHIWQYYQQHLYYLQQQQLQQKNSQQQQHPENQALLQIQQQSQTRQESQQHLSTEKNQSLELQQQEQTSQFQQQNPQMHHTQQQQQQLLYMQQQQHLYLQQQQQQQLYLQQQLLQQQLLQQQQQQYQQQAQQIIAQQQQKTQQLQQQQLQQPQLLQQQQQPQLLQQQQQQQQPDLFQQQQQQQQQELLQQQQQQLFLLQQQQLYQLQLQQRRQQISASELQALNISYYLQTLPVQYGNYQRRQDLGQEAETSQGEGADLQTAEHSGSSYPSTPQQGATKQ